MRKRKKKKREPIVEYKAVNKSDEKKIREILPKDGNIFIEIDISNNNYFPHQFTPQSYQDKLIGMTIATSGSYDGTTTYVMYNYKRLDHDKNTGNPVIDQDVYGYYIDNSNDNLSTNGVFLRHGDWDGRTEEVNFDRNNPPADFKQFLREHPITSGALEQLPESQRNAFEELNNRLGIFINNNDETGD